MTTMTRPRDAEQLPANRMMRGNAGDVRRGYCRACRCEVLLVRVQRLAVMLDVAELDPEPDAGLVVAVAASGKGRPLRLPGGRETGEALHRPHELTCEARR